MALRALVRGLAASTASPAWAAALLPGSSASEALSQRQHHHCSCCIGRCCHDSSSQQQVRPFSAGSGGGGAPPSAAVQLALIKELREKSQAPISDVKSCLVAGGWSVDAAYELLRQRGLAAAAKKASRHAAEGLVAVALRSGPAGGTGAGAGGGRSVAAVVELNSETDFVARNELFVKLVGRVVQAVLKHGPSLPPSPEGGHLLEHSAVSSLQLDGGGQAGVGGGGGSVADACAEVAAQMRENVRLRRAYYVESDGLLSSYVHLPSGGPGMGRIAALVALEAADGSALTQAARGSVSELGPQLAMHVAGLRPQYVRRAEVPPAVMEHERETVRQQFAASGAARGKPDAVVARMVEGRLAKWAEEACLEEQRFVLEDTARVRDVVDRAGKAAGVQLALRTFLRVQCGEGLSQQEAKADFATEVAEMVRGTA